MNAFPTSKTSKEGAALLVALWVLIILSLIVGSFAFEMKLESMLVSYEKKRFQAEVLAQSGFEFAKAVIDKSKEAKELEIEDLPPEEQEFALAGLHISRGLTVHLEEEQGQGAFQITIESAEGKKNVNSMDREAWLDLFEYCQVPSDETDFLLGCLKDWTDQDEGVELNGAESDDPFYEERGYPCKNAPLDSVEELLLIKGWNEDILYGRPAEKGRDAIFGIADQLTVWGDGKININSATRPVLEGIPTLDDEQIQRILDGLAGDDGQLGTADDGYKQLPSFVNSSIFKLNTSFVKVTSVGDVHGIQYQISCILYLQREKAVPVFWEEGPTTP